MADRVLSESIIEDGDVAAAVDYAKAHMEWARQDRDIPGLSAVVICQGTWVWSGGFGIADVALGRPASEQTIYPLASITKVITACAVMRLRDEGKLSLDDPIDKFIDPFPVKRPSADTPTPTLRQIASHTAGFQRETPTDAWETLEFPSIDELLPLLPECELMIPPLTEHKYSNLAYALLGHVVSLVAGVPYEEYVAEAILQPLGMESSVFDATPGLAPWVVTRYPWCDEDELGEPGPPLNVGCFKPVGGLMSTVDDIARFSALHLGHPPEGSEGVLSASSVREMQTLQWVHPDWSGGHCIGWSGGKVAGRFVVGHSGGLPGLSTDLRLVPELELGVAVFTNGGGAASAVCTEVLEILIPAVGRAEKRRKPKPPKEAPQEWAAYVGRYGSTMGKDELEVLIIDGRLLVKGVGGPLGEAVSLKPTEEDHVFIIQGGGSKGEKTRFVLGEEGRAETMSVGGYPYRRGNG